MTAFRRAPSLARTFVTVIVLVLLGALLARGWEAAATASAGSSAEPSRGSPTPAPTATEASPATPPPSPAASGSETRSAAPGSPTESPSTQGTAPASPPVLPYELRLGKAVFQYYCQTCHGETGAGDGFNAFNLDPHPRDLSDPSFQKTKKDADLADAIRRGGSGVGLSALMPPWGRTLTDRQVSEVILYLRSLRRKEP